jgi:hypothetical protein
VASEKPGDFLAARILGEIIHEPVQGDLPRQLREVRVARVVVLPVAIGRVRPHAG